MWYVVATVALLITGENKPYFNMYPYETKSACENALHEEEHEIVLLTMEEEYQPFQVKIECTNKLTEEQEWSLKFLKSFDDAIAKTMRNK